MKTDLEKAIGLIEEWRISDFFDFVKSKKGENELLNRLAKRFITNHHNEDYDEQLRLLATWLFSGNPKESKKAGEALTEKGTITVQDAKNVVLGNTFGDVSGGIRIGDEYHYHNGERQIPRLLTPSSPFQATIFIGREEELKTVHDRLFGGDNFLMLVNGQGGIGKTTFASKYWLKYENEYSHLAFLYVENGIANALLSLSKELGLKFEKETTDQQLEILIKTTEELKKPCLLILDNANNREDLEKNMGYLKRFPKFHILVTSRIGELEAAIPSYKIEPLKEDFPLKLFTTHYPKHQESENKLFWEFFDWVGGNTLVIEIMAKNLYEINSEKTFYSLQTFLDDLANKGLLHLSEQEKVKVDWRNFPKNEPEIIIKAMYDLRPLDEEELFLLSVFSVLPAENIGYDTLISIVNPPNEKIFAKILQQLFRKGWIEKSTQNNKSHYKISPVVQDIVIEKNRNNMGECCEVALRYFAPKLKFDALISVFFEKFSVVNFASSVIRRIIFRVGYTSSLVPFHSFIFFESRFNYHHSIQNIMYGRTINLTFVEIPNHPFTQINVLHELWWAEILKLPEGEDKQQLVALYYISLGDYYLWQAAYHLVKKAMIEDYHINPMVKAVLQAERFDFDNKVEIYQNHFEKGNVLLSEAIRKYDNSKNITNLLLSKSIDSNNGACDVSILAIYVLAIQRLAKALKEIKSSHSFSFFKVAYEYGKAIYEQTETTFEFNKFFIVYICYDFIHFLSINVDVTDDIDFLLDIILNSIRLCDNEINKATNEKTLYGYTFVKQEICELSLGILFNKQDMIDNFAEIMRDVIKIVESCNELLKKDEQNIRKLFVAGFPFE